MKDTTVLNAEQLGRSVRLKRLEKGLSQVSLAAQSGVERKWIIHLESGNPKAELGLVLKALDALNLQVSLIDKGRAPATDHSGGPSRIDEAFRRLERRGGK